MDTMIIDSPVLLPRQPALSPIARDLSVKYRNRLDQSGLVHVAATDTQRMGTDLDPTAIAMAAAEAPRDPNDSHGLRRRLYRTGVYQPHSGTMRFDDVHLGQDGSPYVPYYQEASINSDAAGQARRFAPLPDRLEQNGTLRQLVRIVFEMIPGDLIDRHRNQAIGMHLTQLWSDGRQRAMPSPPHLHTDGEPWTAIILIDRVNCAQGSAVNYIAKRHCRGKQPQDCDRDDIIAAITMHTPLEIIMVDDARVSHHVSGVHGANGMPGFRTTLLIDVSPLHPERTS